MGQPANGWRNIETGAQPSPPPCERLISDKSGKESKVYSRKWCTALTAQRPAGRHVLLALACLQDKAMNSKTTIRWWERAYLPPQACKGLSGAPPPPGAGRKLGPPDAPVVHQAKTTSPQVRSAGLSRLGLARQGRARRLNGPGPGAGQGHACAGLSRLGLKQCTVGTCRPVTTGPEQGNAEACRPSILGLSRNMPRRAVPSRLGRKQSNAGRAGLSRLGLKQSKKKKKKKKAACSPENILHTVDKRGCGAKLGFLGKPGFLISWWALDGSWFNRGLTEGRGRGQEQRGGV